MITGVVDGRMEDARVLGTVVRMRRDMAMVSLYRIALVVGFVSLSLRNLYCCVPLKMRRCGFRSYSTL